ncbi:cupin domain-containing protein [Streptomyces sp. NPDC101149]|uniref:cupin domain-containing protein n=1 Tax=Streptomyces sp. NPDC101149 TaxID=3366113 RepID=UPI00381A54F8
MTFRTADSSADGAGRRESGIYVPPDGGIVRWFSGDVYTIKLTAEQTGGSVGILEASVPPGGGPAAHSHTDQDETFYLISGELEFLDGDRIFNAGPGGLVHCPRGTRHRFKNVGFHTARMLFFYTPGGSEGLFLEGGDEPQPGVAVPPWGPEKFENESMLELFKKYGSVTHPEA